jgi:hypothetical protein
MAATHPFAQTVSPRTLAPGACVDRVPVAPARTVPCDQRHIAEIVAVFPYPATPGAAYPPILELYRQSLDRCHAEFDAYTGTTADQTPASPFVAVPAQYEWNGGERLIVCYATAQDGGDLTAPLRRP